MQLCHLQKAANAESGVKNFAEKQYAYVSDDAPERKEDGEGEDSEKGIHEIVFEGIHLLIQPLEHSVNHIIQIENGHNGSHDAQKIPRFCAVVKKLTERIRRGPENTPW